MADIVAGSAMDSSWVKLHSLSVFNSFDLTTIFIFTIVFLTLLFVMGRPATSIPGPLALPIIGNLHQFISMGTKRHLGLLSLRKKYGNVFRLYLGPYLMVFISGYENIHDAFVKHAGQFSDRPNWLPDIQKRAKKTGHGEIIALFELVRVE
jgi:cytochrome P450 family 2 subfamily J